jgi:activating signal cointegrator complex subunit 3
MSPADIGALVRHPAAGERIQALVDGYPYLTLQAALAPITRTVLRISLTITPAFEWRDKAHGAGLRWWVWVEDTASENLYHSELWTLTKKMARCAFLGGACFGVGSPIVVFASFRTLFLQDLH